MRRPALTLAMAAGLFLLHFALVPGLAQAGDWTQWCGRADRNMVSDEKGLPDRFDEVTDKKTTGLANVKWAARLGSGTYGSPVIAGGKVYVGGGEGSFGDDRTVGMLWCFRESDGTLLWRMRSPFCSKLLNRSFGITATPTVDDDHVYIETHNGDVLCLSPDGLAAGNHGPFTDEANYFASGRKRIKHEIARDGHRILEWSAGTPATLGPLDADVLWKFDPLREANAWPFNAVNTSPVVRGNVLYVATCTTLSGFQLEGSEIWINEWKKTYHEAHYDSPSLVALDKNTGKLLAVEKERVFERTFHGAHSTPALATVNGHDLVILGGGDGTCYAFEADFAPGAGGAAGELKLAWKFNALDPGNYRPGLMTTRLNAAEVIASPVFYRNRVYFSIGNDLHKSGRHAGPGRLLCVDATKSGDISGTGLVWAFDKIQSTSSTAAIADGLLYTADAAGTVYCLDADTGKVLWTHETAQVWGSPLVADGKVFVPTNDRGLIVFAHGREKKVLSDAAGRENFVGSPAAANGALYLASQKYLYALQAGSSGSVVEAGR